MDFRGTDFAVRAFEHGDDDHMLPVPGGDDVWKCCFHRMGCAAWGTYTFNARYTRSIILLPSLFAGHTAKSTVSPPSPSPFYLPFMAYICHCCGCRAHRSANGRKQVSLFFLGFACGPGESHHAVGWRLRWTGNLLCYYRFVVCDTGITPEWFRHQPTLPLEEERGTRVWKWACLTMASFHVSIAGWTQARRHAGWKIEGNELRQWRSPKMRVFLNIHHSRRTCCCVVLCRVGSYRDRVVSCCVLLCYSVFSTRSFRRSQWWMGSSACVGWIDRQKRIVYRRIMWMARRLWMGFCWAEKPNKIVVSQPGGCCSFDHVLHVFHRISSAVATLVGLRLGNVTRYFSCQFHLKLTTYNIYIWIYMLWI